VSDIFQVATETEIIFSANTPRAHTWMLYCFGSSIVTYRLPNEKEMAEELQVLAKAEKFKIAKIVT
jgi:hypothetical protein